MNMVLSCIKLFSHAQKLLVQSILIDNSLTSQEENDQAFPIAR